MDQVLASLQGAIASNEKNQRKSTATLAGISAGIAVILLHITYYSLERSEISESGGF